MLSFHLSIEIWKPLILSAFLIFELNVITNIKVRLRNKFEYYKVKEKVLSYQDRFTDLRQVVSPQRMLLFSAKEILNHIFCSRLNSLTYNSL